MHNWNGQQITFLPHSRSLVAGKESIDLKDNRFESLDDADFSEAKIYLLNHDSSYFCFEFGFGGLLRSGSFQNIKGVIVLHSEINKHTSLLYLQGIKISCKQINFAKSN